MAEEEAEADIGCSKYKIFFILTTIFFVIALVLLIPGGGMLHSNRIAKKTYELNTCEVMESSYYEKICRGSRFSPTGTCFVPVWTVTYSIVEEILIDATIEDNDSFWTTDEAQHKVEQYQIGMSYTCWCSVVDPSKASWREPNTFAGMMLVIFGCLVATVGIVGIFLTRRECIKLKI